MCLVQQEFWNATSFEMFMTQWNSIVRDWLYTYVYKDLRGLGCPPRAAKYLTVCVSAAFHEYIACISFRYVMPFLFGFYLTSVGESNG